MYVPSPMRCKNCLRIEHTSKHCTNKPRCLHCGLEHSYENCPSKETIAHRCANCGGGHSAVDKTCPKFVCIQDKLKNAATKRQSYQHVLVGHDTAAAAVDPLVAQTTIGPIESIKLYFESSFEKFATQFTSDIQRVLGEYGSAIQKVKAVMSEQIDKVEKKNFGAWKRSRINQDTKSWIKQQISVTKNQNRNSDRLSNATAYITFLKYLTL